MGKNTLLACAAALRVIALFTAAAAANAWSAEDNRLDTRLPVTWLNERAFDQLEQHLDALYQQVQDNPADEYKLYLTYTALGKAHGKTTRQLRQWLNKHPQSPQAHLVRAAQVITRTKDNSMLEKAALDLQTVLSTQPDHPIAHYYYAISLCRIGGARCIEYLLPLQNEDAPHAYFARRALLGFMKPAWGADSDMLPAYLDAAAEGIALNPHWKPLAGYGDFAACQTHYGDKDYQPALEACEQALSYGVDDLYIGKLSDTFAQLGRFDQARGTLERLAVRLLERLSIIPCRQFRRTGRQTGKKRQGPSRDTGIQRSAATETRQYRYSAQTRYRASRPEPVATGRERLPAGHRARYRQLRRSCRS